jgi:hypothetical protein
MATADVIGHILALLVVTSRHPFVADLQPGKEYLSHIVGKRAVESRARNRFDVRSVLNALGTGSRW